MGDIADKIFNDLQLELLLKSAEQISVSPNNEFCTTWIETNSERLRNYWNNSSCKTCKFNTKCLYIYELLKREINA